MPAAQTLAGVWFELAGREARTKLTGGEAQRRRRARGAFG
jgi:hypothetical protein